METNKNKLPGNNLRQARKRAGLKQKQVAFLLSPKSPDDISRYERSLNLPNLKTALKFEAIYRMPVRLLFQELFDKCRHEVDERKKRDAQLMLVREWFPDHAEKLIREEFCFYSELLKNHVPGSAELEVVRNHIVSLMNVSNDFKNGRRPFITKH